MRRDASSVAVLEERQLVNELLVEGSDDFSDLELRDDVCLLGRCRFIVAGAFVTMLDCDYNCTPPARKQTSLQSRYMRMASLVGVVTH